MLIYRQFSFDDEKACRYWRIVLATAIREEYQHLKLNLSVTDLTVNETATNVEDNTNDGELSS